jgi:hypothetical protein
MPFEFKSYGKVVATVYDLEGLGKKLDGAYTYLEQLQQKRFEERTGSYC